MFGNFSSSQPAASTPLFGGANTASSPFGSTQSTTTTNAPLFGASASTTPTPASNSMFGATPAATTTTTAPLFGNASTGAASAATFGSSLTVPTNSPFGSTASGLNTSGTTSSPFGAASKPTTSTPLFGAANTTTPATSGFSFGGAAASTATTTPSLSSFSAAPAVEAKSALSDGTVPHYTIGPHSIMRQTAPPPSSSAGFMPASQKEVETKLSASDISTKPHTPTFQEKRTVLPGFLTSVGSSPKSEIVSKVGGDGVTKR
ncbi:hypothetical protein K450DRAFT_257102 [Umbelopsis ramanniana AG]|uniref:Uncharacterized protein n=1 Tax=Umbelopsis ramanniana AG TaxID=1314678 RepID=A0AAD5E404_UMBRA|nr:uncharacterized protein K450DRAFT_257102 [Umbelopsis ramanniana AG]KAI8576397.1 hypothetical protein K450DRAFT_257102 [Umbelopsis ramanniana AG]